MLTVETSTINFICHWFDSTEVWTHSRRAHQLLHNRTICILKMQKMNICLLDSTCIEMSYCFWCNRYIGCYIFNTVLSCAKSMMLCKKKLAQNAGSCTTWFIRQFLFGIDPFFYQCVTAHIKWKWPEQARKVSGYGLYFCFYWILKLFQQCGICFLFHFIISYGMLLDVSLSLIKAKKHLISIILHMILKVSLHWSLVNYCCMISLSIVIYLSWF